MPKKQKQGELKDWFMKNIILPNNEIIDKAGFIIYQFNEKDKNAFMREMLFPELLLADIEKRIRKTTNKKDDLALYRAGKRWGYRFANGALMPLFSKTPKKDFLAFLDAFAKLIEAEYSRKFEYTLNLKDRILQFEGDDMVVCEQSGGGQLFLGAWTGVWAYQNEDPTFEGAHTKCQGRGDKKCIFICGPRAKIKGPPADIELDESSSIEASFYNLNKPHVVNSQFSLRRFMELRHIIYNGGFFEFGKEKLVLNESSSLYFMEDEFKKIGAGRILFDAAFDYFKKFAKKHNEEFFVGFLMACGWGEIRIIESDGKYKVICKNFPWTSLAKNIDFQMLRGAFSGFLSAKAKRRLELNKWTTNIFSNYLEIAMDGG